MNINEIYKSKEKLKKTFVKGVKKITDVFPIKKEGEFVIVCAGSNLKEVLCLNQTNQLLGCHLFDRQLNLLVKNIEFAGLNLYKFLKYPNTIPKTWKVLLNLVTYFHEC